MRIDSHQHFWRYNPVRDSWIDKTMGMIRKDFLPADLKPILKENKIDSCIVVQADQSEEETQFLLNLAKNNSIIKGVVGWVDLLDSNVEERLAYFSKDSNFKGVRHIVQGESINFLLREDFQRGIGKLAQFGLTYDILVYPNQLKNVIGFVEKFPNQVFVLNHFGKPNIKEKKIEGWKNNIKKLAIFNNVYCKISGAVTEANWNKWKETDFKDYYDVVFKAFGAERILFGSDWPVCLLAAEYRDVLKITENYLSLFSEEEKNRIMGLNAVEIYL